MIPKEHLEAMCFEEISEGLFMKDLGNGVKLFRDYRNNQKASYAYRYSQKIPKDLFQELKAIEKIEKHVLEEHTAEKGTLLAHC